MRSIVIDLDDTLCVRNPTYEYLGSPAKYSKCKPLKYVIGIVNEKFRGDHVTIYTSRGMTSLKGNISLIESKLRKVTEQQLQEWGVRYDALVFGKLHYDLLIDDKVLNVEDINKL